MMPVMVVFFLLQVFQRLAKHECDDTCAGYHKQKVRHGSHLLPVKFRGGMVSSLPLYIGKISDLFIQSQTTSFVNPLSVSFPYFAAIGRLQLVDISKIDLNSKIKKFSHSFICGKGYSPPSGGIAFCLQSASASAAFEPFNGFHLNGFHYGIIQGAAIARD